MKVRKHFADFPNFNFRPINYMHVAVRNQPGRVGCLPLVSLYNVRLVVLEDLDSDIGPCSHWLDDCAKSTPTPEENDQKSANHSKCNTSSKPIHFYNYNNYTPL